MKPDMEARGPSVVIAKRRTRGFATRDQRLPASPPVGDDRTTAQTIMHAMRVKYRDALEALFGRPERVLNNECCALLFGRAEANSLRYRAAHVAARGPSSSAPMLPTDASSVPRRSLSTDSEDSGSRETGGRTAPADQVVPSMQGSQQVERNDRGEILYTQNCSCATDIWRPGGVGPEDMLRTAKELSTTIMTLYARVVDPVTSTVDYSALLHCDDFKNYLHVSRKLRYFDPLSLNDEERKAFFLNVYNSLMIHAIAALWRPKNPYERIQLYNTAAYCIGGRNYSLNMIEHGVLRANRPGGGPLAQIPFMEDDARRQCALPAVDPRIHFALNCGARSCPAVRYYDLSNIDQALDMACRNFLNNVSIDLERRTVTLSKIFQWYRMDFTDKGDDEALLKWILPYLSVEKKSQLVRLIEGLKLKGLPIKVAYADYDWSVNDSSV